MFNGLWRSSRLQHRIVMW